MLSMLLRLFRRDSTIQPETRPRQKAFCKAGRRRWHWGRHRSVGKESSQAYTISEQEQRVKRLEKLKRDLERMSNERDELRGILAHYNVKDLNNRFNFETIMLEMQHDQVTRDLKNIPKQISEALYKCQELTKNNQLYSIRNCHLLTESLRMKSEVKMLWNENRQLLKEQIKLEVCSKETRRLCVEASMKIYDKFSKHIQQFIEIFSPWSKPYDRLNMKFRMLHLQHEKTTMNMQKMTSRMCDAIENCKKLIEENYSYRHISTHVDDGLFLEVHETLLVSGFSEVISRTLFTALQDKPQNKK
ncbi:disks large homolog 5-like [Arvicanthis niloticus]|uniref:disks large homolog 5-like n=1 Tax=Arvicanthis niloticus TaxID=61156 RepID=UPI00403D0F42